MANPILRLIPACSALLLFSTPGAAMQEGLPAAAALGAYRTPAGETLLVGMSTEDQIGFRDLATGAHGRLDRVSPDHFEADGRRLTLLRAHGEVEGLATELVGGQRRTAARIPLELIDLAWVCDGTRISGTLVLPDGEGPWPLVIAQPGSSWTTRENEHGLFTALIFAMEGVAGLAYDKRGYGASDGEPLVTFERTARDLACVVDAVRLRFDIHPERIGVFGLSQGGWIAPLAATMTDGIRSLVLVGAPGTTPARQETRRAVAVLRALDRPADEVEAIREFQRLAFRYGSTGEGWNEYSRARERAEGAEWLGRVWSPTEPGPQHWMWGRLNGDYNPLPALLSLRIPVLALWGEFDLNVDPEVNRSLFEVALRAAGNRDHTLEIVRGADHVLQRTGSAREALDSNPYATEAWVRIVDWVRRVDP